MTNIYEKSLELMDVHFDSVTDEEFMQDYLTVEELKGPLVIEYLSLFDNGYDIQATVSGSLKKAESLDGIDLSCFVEDSIEFNSTFCQFMVNTIPVHTTVYDPLFAANDDLNQNNIAA